MGSDKKGFKLRSSELALTAVLICLVALTRVYYGGDRGLMIVWKGELTFHDTLVNLSDMLKLSREELMSRHRSVLYQLEAMEVLEPVDVELENIRHRKWHGRSEPDREQHSDGHVPGDQEPVLHS